MCFVCVLKQGDKRFFKTTSKVGRKPPPYPLWGADRAPNRRPARAPGPAGGEDGVEVDLRPEGNEQRARVPAVAPPAAQPLARLHVDDGVGGVRGYDDDPGAESVGGGLQGDVVAPFRRPRHAVDVRPVVLLRRGAAAHNEAGVQVGAGGELGDDGGADGL